jgi:hypothetical protein
MSFFFTLITLPLLLCFFLTDFFLVTQILFLFSLSLFLHTFFCEWLGWIEKKEKK